MLCNVIYIEFIYYLNMNIIVIGIILKDNVNKIKTHFILNVFISAWQHSAGSKTDAGHGTIVLSLSIMWTSEVPMSL